MEDDGHHGSIANAKVGEVLARSGGGRAVDEFGPSAVLRETGGDRVGEAGKESSAMEEGSQHQSFRLPHQHPKE